MLLSKNRRGHEHDGLLPGLHRLEGRADCDLRLAVPHISDQETIHGASALHVALDLVGCAALVGGVLIKEGGLKLALPRRIGGKCIASRQLSPCIQVEQFRRHRAYCRPRLVALALPCRRAQPMQPRRRRVTVAISTHRAIGFELIDAIEGHIEPIATFVFDDRNLERYALRPDRDGLEAAIDPDPMLEVDDVAPRGKGPRGGGADGTPIAARAPQAAGTTE